MNIEMLREYCLAKEGAEETMPFGPDTLVYKVNGKIFLVTGLDADILSFSVKCNPELAIELRERYPCVRPGYHLNKKHWNTVTVDGSVPVKELKNWIDHSYSLIAKRSAPLRKQPKSSSRRRQ